MDGLSHVGEYNPASNVVSYSIPELRNWIHARTSGLDLDGKLFFLKRLEVALGDVRKFLLEVK